VEDRSVIEEGQVGHVLTFLKLGRIDLPNLFRRKDFFLEKMNKMVLNYQFFHSITNCF
jgi:hypothetical protein